MDFMMFLEEAAQEEMEARRLDEFPRLVARAQAAQQRMAKEDPMALANAAGVTRQHPVAPQITPTVEREEQTDFWSVFLQGVLLGGAIAVMVAVRLLA